MKIVIIALLVAVAYAAQVLPLSGLSTAVVNPAYTLTSAYPVPSPNVVLTVFTGITTYAMATPTGAVVGAVTFTITYNTNVNQTVSAGVVYGTGINANAIFCPRSSTTSSGGVTTDVYSNSGTIQTLRFDTAGTYGAVVYAQSSVGYTYTSLGFPAAATGQTVTVTGAYTEPVLATFNMITPNGCTTTGCTDGPNATATVTPVVANNWQVTALFRATGTTQAGVFVTASSCDANSFCNFDTSGTTWTANFGGFSATSFLSLGSLAGGSTLVPQGGAAAGSANIFDTRNFYSTYVNEQTFGGKQGPITFPVGSTDVTPPTCASAIFTPASGNTVSTSVTSELAIVCTDPAGGSGLFRKGAFGVTTATGASSGVASQTFTYNQVAATVSSTEAFPAYVSGTIQIVGVWAVDNAMNSVLYGSCGTAGYTTIGCAAGTGGSGSSSASSVSLSLFALFSLVVLAFFA